MYFINFFKKNTTLTYFYALVFTFFVSKPLIAQVGINNTNPKASLDITANNPVSPSNTEGLLVPRVSNFPAINPTIQQEGMLIYLTAVVGLDTPGYYYWDNSATDWVKLYDQLSLIDDKDWNEVGTNIAPNSVNDNIYTYGRVAIGKNTIANNTLDIYEYSTNNKTIHTLLEGNLNGATYSAYFRNANSGNGDKYGVYSLLNGAGNNNFYASYNEISTNGSGSHFGTINKLTDSSNGLRVGTENLITNSGSNNNIGVRNFLDGFGIGNRYGISNLMQSNSSGQIYGTYNDILGSGSGRKFGTFNFINSASGGTHYGIYSEVRKTGSFAALFNGRVAIGQSSYIVGSPDWYILPETRGTANQIMQTDGNGLVSWVDADSVNDHDWYKENTTSSPNNINNNIYTQGNVGIGKINPQYSLDINTSGDSAIFISVDGTDNNTKNGIRNLNLSTGNGTHYGTYNALIGSGSGQHNGTFNDLDGNGTGSQYGSYQRIINSGNGIHVGSNNILSGSGTGLHIGVNSLLSGTGTGDQFGSYQKITNEADGNHYGFFSILEGTGSGNKYGIHNFIPNTSGGTHYGIYSNVTKNTGYAGYFLGRVSIGTTTVNNYILPASRGTANQIMQTDGSGNVSWVNNTNTSNWSRTGTNLDVANVGDDIYFTSDQTSITFPATTGSPSSMIYLFDSGINNSNRMVLSHSPGYSNWGLEFEDTTEIFRFTAGGISKVEIDLSIGYPLRVYGTARATDFESNTTTYPDYVFENYFNGSSQINSNYRFKTLLETEKFIKKEGHLPGVKSYEEIKEKGMVVNLAETSITNLEKIEELFLYAIETKKENNQLQERVNKLEQKLNKIEQFLNQLNKEK